MWKEGKFDGYGQRLYEMEVKEGVWKDRKLVTPKDKVPEEQKLMDFDYKYFIGAKGRPQPK